MDNQTADIEFRRNLDEIVEEWSKVTDTITRSLDSFTSGETFRRLQESIGAVAEDMVKAFVERFMQPETRPLTWRERLRPRWRIFQWLHDLWYGVATFFCGERLNLHRGSGVEDWVAELFERDE